MRHKYTCINKICMLELAFKNYIFTASFRPLIDTIGDRRTAPIFVCQQNFFLTFSVNCVYQRIYITRRTDSNPPSSCTKSTHPTSSSVLFSILHLALPSFLYRADGERLGEWTFCKTIGGCCLFYEWYIFFGYSNIFFKNWPHIGHSLQKNSFATNFLLRRYLGSKLESPDSALYCTAQSRVGALLKPFFISMYLHGRLFLNRNTFFAGYSP